MRKAFVSLLQAALLTFLALPVLASAEAQVDHGTTEAHDPFTGTYTCSQRVSNASDDPSGIGLTVSSEWEEVGVTLFRPARVWPTDFAFDTHGPFPPERLYIRFGFNDVETHAPTAVELDLIAKREAATVVSDALAYRILAAPSDLRVRFEGLEGEHEFIIEHGVIRTLARGFGRACIR